MHLHQIGSIVGVAAPLKTPDPQAPCGTLREVLAFNVRMYRVNKPMSQEQLGLAAELDRTFISQVERARINVSVDNIEKLAITLGIDASLLFVRPK
ncbi:MAG: helix-turn-helix transcriptional regulator [Xylophilus ampelinus]